MTFEFKLDTLKKVTLAISSSLDLSHRVVSNLQT